MSAEVRANAVEVAKGHQARCRLEGCGWSGELLGSYQEANADRQAHLDWHRQRQAGGAVSGEMNVPRCEKCGRYPIDHRGGACIYPRQGAELAARRTAAAAVLGDFRAVEAAFERGQHDRPSYAGWALRLAQHLRYVLDELAAADTAPAQSPSDAAQLEEIGLVLAAFDWTGDGDARFALEQIDDILRGVE